MNRTKKEIVCNHIKRIICLNVFFAGCFSAQSKIEERKGAELMQTSS